MYFAHVPLKGEHNDIFLYSHQLHSLVFDFIQKHLKPFYTHFKNILILACFLCFLFVFYRGAFKACQAERSPAR